MKNGGDFTELAFPCRVSEQELRGLFAYLARKLVGTIEYHIETSTRVGWEKFGDEWAELEKRAIRGGGIYFKDRMNWLTFSTTLNCRDEGIGTTYYGLRFEVPPGIPREELERTHTSNPGDMECVGRHIREYFHVSPRQ